MVLCALWLTALCSRAGNAAVSPTTNAARIVPADLSRCRIVLQSNASVVDQANAIRELRDAGPGAAAAVPELLDLLRDGKRSDYLRVLSAEALGAISTTDVRVVEVLITVIRESGTTRPSHEAPPDAAVQSAHLQTQAAMALVQIGDASDPVVRALSDAARREESPLSLRLAAARGLGELRERSSPGSSIQNPTTAAIAVNALQISLQNRNTDVRRAAAVSLSKFGVHAKSAIPGLAAQLEGTGGDAVLYAHVAKTFAAVVAIVGRESRWLENAELAATLAAIDRGVLALRRRGGEEFKEELATGTKASEDVEREIRSRKLKLPFGAWLAFGIVGYVLCLTGVSWRWPRATAALLMWLRSANMKGTIKVVFVSIQDLRLGSFLAFVTLLGFFANWPGVRRQLEEMNIKKTAHLTD